MIDIQFKFVDAPLLIRNQYILTVDYMHGDADGDTSEEHSYGDDAQSVSELKMDLLGLMTFIKSNAEFDEATEEIAPIFEAQGVEDAYDLAEEWVDKFHESDITCEGRGAAITDYRLAYYDDSGYRHDVDLYINGRKVE